MQFRLLKPMVRVGILYRLLAIWQKIKLNQCVEFLAKNLHASGISISQLPFASLATHAPVEQGEIEMKRSFQNVLAIVGVVVGILFSPTASAVPYSIKFYEANLSHFSFFTGFNGDDPDGDGVADGVGVLNSVVPGFAPVPITSFNATVGGSTWDSLASSGQFPSTPMLHEFGGIWLDGFVFADPADIGAADPVTVLQLTSLGGFLNQDGTITAGYGLWTLSPCSSYTCGGAIMLGTYVITEGAPVPAPATLPLALLGIAALAAVRRRHS